MTQPKKNKNQIRIGGGAGFSGDRIDSAVELVAKGELDYIVLECLAERTVALGNLIKIREPDKGYSETLSARIKTLLPVCLPKGVRIISNMGSANPMAAAERSYEIAQELGFPDMQVAVVLGDDVLDIIKNKPDLILLESGKPLESILPQVISANAYLGADAIIPALKTGHALVLTGRVADPSLFLSPMIHEFNWSYNDYKLLAQGTVAGHLLECAGQLTGGYFADPDKKNVPDLARLGFPYADVTREGKVILGKTPDTGGRLDVMTCTEQLIYEIHDPSRYITPDCILDVTDVQFKLNSRNCVHAFGARALPRTDTYKVSVGYMGGYMGEGQISYAGPNAVERARLAGKVVAERLKNRGFDYLEIHEDLIGINSLHGKASPAKTPYEIRLRLAVKCPDKTTADAVGEEVEALLTNGPAGGGGFFRQTKELVAIESVFLPRHLVKPTLQTIGKS